MPQKPMSLIVGCTNKRLTRIIVDDAAKDGTQARASFRLPPSDALLKRLHHITCLAQNSDLRPLVVAVPNAHRLTAKDLPILVQHLRIARHVGIAYVLGYPNRKRVQPVVQALAREMIFPGRPRK